MLLHTDMGFSEKEVADRGAPWAVVGISLRPVSTKAKSGAADQEEEEEEARSTTPREKEARIPERLPCPPAPKKRKPPVRCQVISGDYFFSPPDLETVFLRRRERAK